MKIRMGITVLVIGLVGASNGYAQSGSIGGGTLTPLGPESVEEPFFGISYSSSASACARAKQEAENAAKKRSNIRATSIGSCSCSSTKKKLWLPQAQTQYAMETGGSSYSDPVDVYECTVDARLSFHR